MPVSGNPGLSLGIPVISSNGHWIALSVTAHVDTRFAQGNTIALDVKVTQELPPHLFVGQNGKLTFSQPLQQGFTQLCITLDGGGVHTSEADKCVDVAFLP